MTEFRHHRSAFTDMIPPEQDPMTFIVDTQFRIQRLMNEKGITNRQLAEALGVSKSRVSNMFGPRPNLTLETLARVFLALESGLPRVTTDHLDALLTRDEQIVPPRRHHDQGWETSPAEDCAEVARPSDTPAHAPRPDFARQPRPSWKTAA